MNIVGVDPGGSTGLAWRTREDVVCTREIKSHSNLAEIDQIMASVRAFACFEFGGSDEVLWIVEDWVDVPGSVLTGESRIVLGLIGAFIAVFGSGNVDISQNASLAKSTFTDARLRRLGLFLGLSPHERDAERHLLTWERRRMGPISKF